jgi:hypothetical protein
VLGLLMVCAAPLLLAPTFTDVGHVTAAVLGLAPALLVARAGRTLR